VLLKSSISNRRIFETVLIGENESRPGPAVLDEIHKEPNVPFNVHKSSLDPHTLEPSFRDRKVNLGLESLRVIGVHQPGGIQPSNANTPSVRSHLDRLSNDVIRLWLEVLIHADFADAVNGAIDTCGTEAKDLVGSFPPTGEVDGLGPDGSSQSQTSRDVVNHVHKRSSTDYSAVSTHQSDTSSPEDGNSIASLEARFVKSGPSSWEGISERKPLFVLNTVRNLGKRRVGPRDSGILSCSWMSDNVLLRI
jgi:hypothetical protein